MVIDEWFDAIYHAHRHLVNFIKDEERFFTFADIASDPVLKMQLLRVNIVIAIFHMSRALLYIIMALLHCWHGIFALNTHPNAIYLFLYIMALLHCWHGIFALNTHTNAI